MAGRDIRGFAVFNYITLRAVMASLTALAIGLLFGPMLIRKLAELKIGQAVRDDGPQTHLNKSGTPTMGGALILMAHRRRHAAVGRSVQPLRLDRAAGDPGLRRDRLGRRLPQGGPQESERHVGARQVLLAVADRRHRRGVPRLRSACADQRPGAGSVRQWVSSGLAMDLPSKADLIVPFFKNVAYPLGVFGFIVLTYLVIVGTSNAVNLTDGADGLAIMPSVLVGAALGIFAYVPAMPCSRSTCCIPYIAGAGELTVFCAAIGGAGLAFLWYNAYPAQVFMGDVGALALGGALGTVAVIVRQEIVLFIMGGCVRRRDAVGDAAGGLVQVHQAAVRRGPAHLPHGAAASPLRSGRRQGESGRRALLDRHDDAGAVRSVVAEAAVTWPASVLVLGLGESGLACALWCLRQGRVCVSPIPAPHRPILRS
jgi:phospho-N-acetylmuramoyl-pentapeptide-transferase